MSPNNQKLILVAAIGLTVCGALVRRDYLAGLIANADTYTPKPTLLDSSSSSANESSPRLPDAAATTAERGAQTDIEEPLSPSEAESFNDWLNRYLKSQPDLRRLRHDLEVALARLPDEGQEQGNSEDGSAMEAIRRNEKTAGTDYQLLMDQVEQFIEVYPQSPLRPEANALYAKYAGFWDEHDFCEARAFSQAEPDNFGTRIAQYQEYIDRHGAAGKFVAESRKAIEQIRVEWSEHEYRSIYEFFVRYPKDARTIATRVSRYVEQHPGNRHREAADQFLARFEKAAAPGEYHVRVRSGKFARTIARTFSLGPDLAVEIEVAGVRVGRTPIVADSFEPAWNYEFPQKIRWRMGDPIRIRVIDFDYSNRTILQIEPPQDDPMAMRFLSGPISADAHTLVLESDFQVPILPAP